MDLFRNHKDYEIIDAMTGDPADGSSTITPEGDVPAAGEEQQPQSAEPPAGDEPTGEAAGSERPEDDSAAPKIDPWLQEWVNLYAALSVSARNRLNVDELKRALTGLNVRIPEDAKKADLLELVEQALDN